MARMIAPTKNVRLLDSAYRSLRDRGEEDDGLVLVYGAPGLGKTVATCALFVRERGLLLRALPGWSQKALLRSLLTELGSDLKGTNAECLTEASRLICENPRPLFVDEADFLVADTRCLETLRALHDMAGVPVVLVGMTSLPGFTGIDRRIKKFPQLSSRIVQWVEFQPADLEDTRLMARACCEVPIDDDLLEVLCRQTKGNFRLIRRGLSRIQRWAKSKQVSVVTAGTWGDNELFHQVG